MFSTHDGSLGGMVQRSTLELKEKVCIDFFLIKNIRSKKKGAKTQNTDLYIPSKTFIEDSTCCQK